MRNYFGTDGIRGVAGEELTARTAFALGNALCRLKTKPLVVLGRDTRTSSDMLSLALEAGVCAGGGSVRDGGVLPTAAVAFFVRRIGADFGVVVSASHNPPEFNGLKVFDFRGCKLSEEDEEYTDEEQDGGEYYADEEEYIGDEDGGEYYADDDEYKGAEEGAQ